MSNTELAFFIGLFGSVHCVGMCGPLAFAVPVMRQGWYNLVFDKFIYQLGRTLSYMLLGLIIGAIGRQIWLAGLQQIISLLSGVLILIAAFSRLFRFSILNNKSSFLLKPFNRLFGYALKHKANHLIIGVINGFLPCGFVYLALAGALNTGSIPKAVNYMFWFGSGTLPLMFIAAVSTGFAGPMVRNRINKVIPYLMLCLGFWFILRGMELNIPYLSPAKAASTVECR